jgi:hypothetical protein
MTDQPPVDPRPRPKYGEYAPISTTPPAAPVTASVVTAAPAPQAPYKTTDIIITAALLLLGVWDVVTGFAGFATLGTVLTQVYTVQGISGFASGELANEAGMALNVARIAILAVTIVVSLLLIARRRRAFWVPLAGGALAGLGVVVCVMVVIVQDPGFIAWAQAQNP